VETRLILHDYPDTEDGVREFLRNETPFSVDDVIGITPYHFVAGIWFVMFPECYVLVRFGEEGKRGWRVSSGHFNVLPPADGG
jgi:hypothetical protein